MGVNGRVGGGRTRSAVLDIAKGAGILLVLAGHALKQAQTGSMWQTRAITLIYSFHMPLFFILAGMTAGRLLHMQPGKGTPAGSRQRQRSGVGGVLSEIAETWPERLGWLKKRAVRLLVPYFAVGLCYVPVKLALNRYAVVPFTVGDIPKLLIGQNPNVSLWFLYILFVVSAIGAALVTERSLRWLTAAAAVLSVLTWAPDRSARTPRYLFFFLLGLELRRTCMDGVFRGVEVRGERGRRRCMVTAAAALAVFAVSLAGLLPEGGGAAVRGAAGFAAALSGSLLMLLFAQRLARTGAAASPAAGRNGARQLQAGRTGAGYLAALGRQSMEVYILSEPVMTAVRIALAVVCPVPAVVCIAVCFAAGLLVPIPAERLIGRWAPWLHFLLFGTAGAAEKAGRQRDGGHV